MTLEALNLEADASTKSKSAKVTLVYQHELPNCPGKSIKGMLVEYFAENLGEPIQHGHHPWCS